MRKKVDARLEMGRVRDGRWASRFSDGLAGAFEVMGPRGGLLRIISSGDDNGTEWEHVSVSLMRRIPKWDEMCFVKEMFWGEEECVVQYHPRKSLYVNCHPNVLHMWKWVAGDFPEPPVDMV